MENGEDHTESTARGDYYSQEHSDAEAQWVQCVSGNGETYYTNVVTGEASWIKPGSELQQQDSSAAWTQNHANEAGDYPETQWETTDSEANLTVSKDTEIFQWLELFDPVQHAVYYFAPQTGEVRWEPPLEGTALVRHCDSEAVLSTIVSLQTAARSQQARARVTTLRHDRLREDQLEENYSENTHIQSFDEGRNGTALLGEHDPAQWVEVYDPTAQQQYYFSPRTDVRRLDVPETFVTSSEDRKVAAAISIQSLSRGRLARRQIQELRAHPPYHEYNNQSLYNLLDKESEREAMSQREMNHQEQLQLKGGDRFWGLDTHERGILLLHLDQEILARTKLMSEQHAPFHSPHSNPVAATMPPPEYPDFDDLNEVMDSEQLQRELQDEHDGRTAMFHEESQQCHNGDNFWGIQAEEARQEEANIVMAQEEAASRRFAESVVEEALSAAWEAEVMQNAAKELAARGGQEQRMQARYLRWFYGQCLSVDELLNYRWPTKQQQEKLEEFFSPVKKRRQPTVQTYENVVESATPYPLDDLVFRERLEHGDLRYGLRSILTVHHQSIHGTKGTRFEITKAPPECAFDEVTAAALLQSDTVLSSGLQRDDAFDDPHERQEDHTEGEDGIPDPHIPARFNGVPPIRDILRGDHRKVNQLPSLSRSNSTAETSKLRHLQKSKTKARIKPNVSSAFAQQKLKFNNRSNSSRPETKHYTDLTVTNDENPHAQFNRQEHQVLSKLFALMDLDGSGTVNQKEMRWALQRDAEIHSLAKTSPLLRLLLKQRTRLEALFSSQTIDGQDGTGTREENSDELSWDEFLARCEHSYVCLMSEGLIEPDAITTTSRAENRARAKQIPYADPSEREAEAQTIRRVFALLDIDRNGVVDVAEVQRALCSSTMAVPKSASRRSSIGVAKELRVLVDGSRALRPMLHQALFMKAFTKFEPLDPRGISEEEFVAFCLEIAQVAAANNLVDNAE
ncbi:unnamed protein product [Phytophthora fragariaefolia]|uniref:Unnamed protein product n=1 Tax=Phytophthora fragariaefolia TaxID=1490495 RepID=A0A9W7CYI5_9STRA|nr:unnamed protein product [Phytophthora fragariaefolia]